MDIFSKIFSYKTLGEHISVNNSKLIGKAPHIAPLAWLHTMYEGLSDTELNTLQLELGTILPVSYKEFLKRTNGLSYFVSTLELYGLKRLNSRSVDIREPFSILTANQNEKPIAFEKSLVVIGNYYVDGSKIVLDCNSKAVFRYSNDYNAKLTSWDGFDKFIESEIFRIAACFDKNGVANKDIKCTLPN